MPSSIFMSLPEVRRLSAEEDCVWLSPRSTPLDFFSDQGGQPIPQMTVSSGQMNYYAHMKLRDFTSEEPALYPDFDYLDYPDSPVAYGQYIGQAFAFFRRQAQGRYSDSTLMRLARAADAVGEGREDVSLPKLLVAQVSASFDELTEVKTGGVVAMAAVWPHMEKRLILCVSRSARRRAYGSVLLDTVLTIEGSGVHTWVGRGNLAGQQFLAKRGLYPTLIAPSGAIRYARSAMDVDEEQDEDGPRVTVDAPPPRRYEGE